MKAVTTIDHAAGTARIEITLESIEDAGEAVNVVTGVSECLWPEIEFTDLPGDAESPILARRPRRRRRRSASRQTIRRRRSRALSTRACSRP